MLNKIIGVLLIAAAAYIWFGYGPSKRESRSDFTKMLISIVMAFVCVVIAGIGICIFNGELDKFF